MRRWSEVADAVAATTKTSEKTAILADYLASLDADALPVAAVFLTGRPFPEADQRTIGIGWAGISGAVLRVAGAEPGRARPRLRPLLRHRDRGRRRPRRRPATRPTRPASRR